MLQTLAKKIASTLVLSEIISPDDIEAYAYGLELLIPKIVLYSLIIVIAALTQTAVLSLLFVIMYMSLRKYTGGFHCKTAEKCLCVSLLIHLLMIALYCYSMPVMNYVLGVLSALSLIIIAIFSPVENENRTLDEGEKHKYKAKSMIIMTLIFVFMMVSVILQFRQLFCSSACSLTADAVLIILSKRRKTDEKEHAKGDS